MVHRGGKPKGAEPTRFEAPRRNALWQADYTEVRVGGDKVHVLVVLDDFSRFTVGHALCEEPSSVVATQTLRRAIARGDGKRRSRSARRSTSWPPRRVGSAGTR